MSRRVWLAGLVVLVVAVSPWLVAWPVAGVADKKHLPRKNHEIDATTLQHKVLCGYQGWFRCPGDPANAGWRHWSRNARRIGRDTLTFEM